MHELVTIKEAAAQCGVSRRTIERWIAAGGIKVVRIGQRTIRLFAADVAGLKRKRRPKQSAG